MSNQSFKTRESELSQTSQRRPSKWSATKTFPNIMHWLSFGSTSTKSALSAVTSAADYSRHEAHERPEKFRAFFVHYNFVVDKNVYFPYF